MVVQHKVKNDEEEKVVEMVVDETTEEEKKGFFTKVGEKIDSGFKWIGNHKKVVVGTVLGGVAIAGAAAYAATRGDDEFESEFDLPEIGDPEFQEFINTGDNSTESNDETTTE